MHNDRMFKFDAIHEQDLTEDGAKKSFLSKNGKNPKLVKHSKRVNEFVNKI